MERFGILGTADIAYRRFLPALKLDSCVEYVGVASRELEKTKKFVETFGGAVYNGYGSMLEDDMISSVYIPLPPALHYEWGKKCIEHDKNVYIEKPFTCCLADTYTLVEFAKSKGKVVFENYMFLYHKQLDYIKRLVFEKKILGDMRLIRINFSFPQRRKNDFRYKKILGGGALLDCGGYTLRLARELLGNDFCITTANLNYVPEFDVDLFGSATLQNSDGIVAQIAFGMDNGYKCELEILGQRGWIKAPRIFTAPNNYDVNLIINIDNEEKNIVVGRDDQFLNAVSKYKELLEKDEKRKKMYDDIIMDAYIMQELRKKGGIV